MNYLDLWPAIQKDLLGCLAADPFIGARPGLLVESGDVESILADKVNKALGPGLDGRNGVGFLVLPIEKATDDNANMPGGPLKLSLCVQFVENVTVNRGPRGTGQPIRIYAAVAEKLLKLYTPVGLTQSLIPANPVIAEFTPGTDDNLRVGQVEFTAMEADFKPFQRLQRPQIVITGAATPSPANPNSYQLTGTATVTVNAPGADPGQIWYTTDNSHPYPNNPQAVPYTNPVAVNKPCLFRVRAFARTSTGSDTAAANFY